jgi:predicted RecA/RadA family phage recombinase
MKNFLQEGEFIALPASSWVHPAHAAGNTYTTLVGAQQGLTVPINQVEGGDPVVCGTLVGVANFDALQSTDLVTAKTRGVFNLSVVGVNAGGNVAVAVGDALFIDPSTAQIDKKVANVKFGIALGAITSGSTAVIPVKLCNQ